MRSPVCRSRLAASSRYLEGSPAERRTRRTQPHKKVHSERTRFRRGERGREHASNAGQERAVPFKKAPCPRHPKIERSYQTTTKTTRLGVVPPRDGHPRWPSAPRRARTPSSNNNNREVDSDASGARSTSPTPSPKPSNDVSVSHPPRLCIVPKQPLSSTTRGFFWDHQVDNAAIDFPSSLRLRSI